MPLKVIRTGLVEAKVDQLNKQVIVSRATRSTFDKAQWQTLHSRLKAWQKNLADVQRVLTNVQTQLDARPTAPTGQRLGR